VPDYLKTRYPAEMTIVLQFQFYDLQIDDMAFSVTLTFQQRAGAADHSAACITVFADPSVNFVLPFQPIEAAVEEAPAPAVAKKPARQPAVTKAAEAKPTDDSEKTGEVVSLDKFRKK